jgi:hypothetical protein
MDKTLGITATSDTLRVHLEAEYREADGLSRVKALLNTTRGFCQITPFRAERGFGRNCEVFPHLPQAMRDASGKDTVGGYWLIAHWVELGLSHDGNAASKGDDQPDHALEYSWLLLQPRDLSDADWFLAARLVAERYNQSAFIWRPNGTTEAGIYGVDGARWSVLLDVSAMLTAMKALTWLRAHSRTGGRSDYESLTSQTAGTLPTRASAYAVHPATTEPTADGPNAIAFYAAVPHCISASMFFAALNVHRGS